MTHVKLIERKQKLMGSPFLIQCFSDQPEEEMAPMMELAFGEIARIENLMTDFRPSPFNAINEAAGLHPVKVNAEIFSLVKRALAYSNLSGGAFDISYASVGHLWRNAMKRGIPLSPEEIDHARQFVDYRKIELNEDTQEIFLPHPDMRIGLGGIGKGYAVDQAFSLLKNLGLKNFTVNGAGDIHVQSQPDAPRPWRIGIRNPFEGREVPMGCLELRNGAIATSGDYERFMEYHGKKYHHVIDGRTGDITSNVASVTIVASSTLVADVTATIVMILGPEKGIDYLNFRKDLYGFLVTTDGDVLRSKSAPTIESKHHERY